MYQFAVLAKNCFVFCKELLSLWCLTFLNIKAVFFLLLIFCELWKLVDLENYLERNQGFGFRYPQFFHLSNLCKMEPLDEMYLHICQILKSIQDLKIYIKVCNFYRTWTAQFSQNSVKFSSLYLKTVSSTLTFALL